MGTNSNKEGNCVVVQFMEFLKFGVGYYGGWYFS